MVYDETKQPGDYSQTPQENTVEQLIKEGKLDSGAKKYERDGAPVIFKSKEALKKDLGFRHFDKPNKLRLEWFGAGDCDPFDFVEFEEEETKTWDKHGAKITYIDGEFYYNEI